MAALVLQGRVETYSVLELERVWEEGQSARRRGAAVGLGECAHDPAAVVCGARKPPTTSRCWRRGWHGKELAKNFPRGEKWYLPGDSTL